MVKIYEGRSLEDGVEALVAFLKARDRRIEYKILQEIIEKIMEKNDEDTRKSIAKFFTYLEENEMIINGTHEMSWYDVNYKGKRVCRLSLDEECVNFLISIVGDYHTEYRDIPINEHMKQIAWENVTSCYNWVCSNSNKCGMGRTKMIFNKKFDNVCRYVMTFSDINIENLECVKKLLEMRKNDILIDMRLNRELNF